MGDEQRGKLAVRQGREADLDRRKLLERRALFLSAAMAAACGAAQPQPKESNEPVTVESPAVTSTSIQVEPAPTARAQRGEDAPPDVVIPDDASERLRNMYVALQRKVAEIQADVGTLADQIDGCAATDCVSDSAVEGWGLSFSTLTSRVVHLEPLCPGSSEAARAYSQAVKKQQAFLNARLAHYRSELVKGAGTGSDFAERFERAVARSNAGRPQPCLDCGDW
ncbi:MAG: hypothetical protein R3B13_10195 [Polyangiaceae bacterium]